MRWFLLAMLALVIAYVLVGSVLHYLVFREAGPQPSQLPASGDAVDNPWDGVHVVLRRTGAETAGELVEAEVRLDPGGGPPPHVHPDQEVNAIVLSGGVTVLIAGEERHLSRGDSVVVPAGRPHQFLNDGDVEARLLSTIRPAGHSDVFLVQYHSFAADTTRSKGDLFWQMALFSPEYDVFSADAPVFLQRAAMFLLGPTARVLEFRSFYPEYAVQAKG